jgi:ADP-heptose:LPS heptosyltransferase
VRPTLLVLRALGMGDLLAVVPALRALAEAFPGHRRVLAAPAWLEDLALLTGAVDEVLPTEPLAPVAASRPEVAVNLHGRGPQSHRLLLATRPGRLLAFRNPELPETEGLPEWREEEHEVARWCRLLRELGIPADPSRLDLQPPPVPVPAPAVGATLVHPGAGSPARRWPAERWAEVARAEGRRGRPVVVTGSAAEAGLVRRVASEAGLKPERVFVGCRLLELAALVAAAGRVVSGDTGVAHLATALRRPSVVLFGPTPPSRWGPPPERRWHRVLWAGRPGDPHAAAPDPGLLSLGPELVLEALAELDGGVARPSPVSSP